MPGLLQSLKGKDLGHITIVAEFWGIKIDASDVRTAQNDLINKIIDPALFDEVMAELPEEARAALDDLVKSGGKIVWDQFTRKYGELREMGPGRRDREEPFINKNASPVEALWYRALVGKTFLASPSGPQEFAYIPDEFVNFLGLQDLNLLPLPGKTAVPREYAHQFPANDWILDDACTLLGGLRQGLTPELIQLSLWSCRSESKTFSLTYNILVSLLTSAGLIGVDNKPDVEATRVFLEASRGQALLSLFENWKTSSFFNDLKQVPGLFFEGNWKNYPVQTRKFILENLALIPGYPADRRDRPAGSWWSMHSFIAWIKQYHPDFQRSSGEYDSWYIRSSEDGEFMRGFEYWEKIEGKLLEFVIGKILFALGFMDIAAQKLPQVGENLEILSFRFSRWSFDLLNHQPPLGLTKEDGRITVRSDASIIVPRGVPRSTRYQLARFCQWNGLEDEIYHYEITPGSLESARSQGLRVDQFVALLKRFSKGIPSSIIRALNRWETEGCQARFSTHTVLRVTHPEILEALRNSKAARFLGDPLGPTVVIVKPGARDKLMGTLRELGYFGEIEPD